MTTARAYWRSRTPTLCLSSGHNRIAISQPTLPVIHDILSLIPRAAHGWPLLSWFEAKNALLAGRKPSEVVATEPEAAFKAAQRLYQRGDQYLAMSARCATDRACEGRHSIANDSHSQHI